MIYVIMVTVLRKDVDFETKEPWFTKLWWFVSSV